MGTKGEGGRQASSTIPTATVPPGQSVVNKEERHKDRSSSYFYYPTFQEKSTGERGTDSSSQFCPLGPCCSCPSGTPSPTLLAHHVHSGLPSPLCLPRSQSLLLNYFHMHAGTRTHTLPLTYCSCSSTVQCCPGWVHV